MDGCALALSSALCALVACGAVRTDPTAAGSPPGRGSLARDAAADALPVEIAALGATCPEDAPWTGTICLGKGYVSCPGGMFLDAKGACIREGGAPLPAAHPASSDADGGDDEADADDQGTPGEVQGGAPPPPPPPPSP